MKTSIFITINSFIGLPPVKQLLSRISKAEHILCIQCEINGFDNFFKQPKIINKTILAFESSKAFNSQKLYHKLIKYVKLVVFFLAAYTTKRKGNVTIYTIDLYSLFLAILFKSKYSKIVYLQYEMIEPSGLNKLDKFFLRLIQKKSRKIDLIITPELNRTKYLKEIFYLSVSDCFLTIPNTNNSSELEISTKPAYSKKVVTHIGAVGLNHHIKNYLEAISKLEQTLYEFRFIGLLTDDVVDLINSYKDSSIIYLGQVLHSDLKKYYLETDIGVILYKDVSLNHRFCAPNKLYEYWSYGIPVLGDKLPGLEGVFTEPFLGELINMKIPSQISNAISKLSFNNNKAVIADFFQSQLKLDNYLEEFSSRLAHK
jgi:glycosyltransferase involved in cell wall biosynthesis